MIQHNKIITEDYIAMTFTYASIGRKLELKWYSLDGLRAFKYINSLIFVFN